MAGLTATGTYLLSGHDGPYALERFTCAPQGDGWGYEATREDPATGTPLGRLELRRAGRVTRLHLEAGGWVLRGAAAGGELLWRRGEQERAAAGDGFTGSSPGFLVLAARLVSLRSSAPSSHEPLPTAAARTEGQLLRLVEVTEPVLATRGAEQVWRDLGRSEQDGVQVDSYSVDDAGTGERRVVRLAGDVVVEAPGVHLQALTLS